MQARNASEKVRKQNKQVGELISNVDEEEKEKTRRMNIGSKTIYSR